MVIINREVFMNEQTLTIIKLTVSILMLVLLGGSFLYGIIVGFKRSLATGIYNLILVLILFFCTKSITLFALKYDLSSISVNINGNTTLYDAIMEYLKQIPQIADILAKNPDALTTVSQIPMMIASPFIFFISFWILKIIIFIISIFVDIIVSIIKAFVGNKKVDKNGKSIKKKKHRLFGGLVGVGTGLIVIVATFIPIFGLNSIVNSLNEIKVDSSGNIVTTAPATVYADDNTEEYTPLLEKFVGKEFTSVFEAINSSVGYKISSVIGIEQLCAAGFNNLTTTKIDGTEVKLKDNIDFTLKTYNDYSKLIEYLKKETLTEEEMTSALAKADSLVENAFKITIVSALADYFLPSIIDELLSDDANSSIKIPESISKDEVKFAITKIVLNVIKDYPFENYKGVIINLLDICKTLNSNHILTPIYNSIRSENSLEKKDYIDLIKNSNDSFSKDISTQITSIKFLQDISKDMLKLGLQEGFKQIGSTYSNEDLTKEIATAKISNLLSNGIDTVKTLDTTKKYYITQSTFASLGKFLNEAKKEDVISSTQYKDIISFVQSKAKSYALPINVDNVIDNLSEVSNFEQELTIIGNSYDDFEFVASNIDSSKEFEITNVNLNKVGKMLDNLNKNTILFKDEVVGLYNQALDLISISNFNNVKDVLKIEGMPEINFENELTAIEPLLTKVFGLKDKNFTTTENIIDIIDIINEFDNIENNTNSPIFGSKMENLLKQTLISIKAISNNETITSVTTSINNEIDNRETKTLKVCVENGILKYAKTLIPDPSSFVDSNIKNLINDIFAQIDTAISKNGVEENYIDLKAEIKNIEAFKNIIDIIQAKDISALTDEDITLISTTLENTKQSKILGNSKNFILDSIFDKLKEQVDATDEFDIKTSLDTVKAKAKNLTFENVYKSLKVLESELSNLSNIDIDSSDVNAITSSLDKIRSEEIFGEDFVKPIEQKAIDKMFTTIKDEIDPADDKLNILSLLDDVKNKAKQSTLKEVFVQFKEFKNQSPVLKNAGDNIETLDIDSLSNSLNIIRKLSLFGDNFTNSIMTKLFQNIGESVPDTHPNKTEIDSILATDFGGLTITDATYKDKLNELKTAINTTIV